ncbi:hypothetical protein B0H12DRAFT_1078829 [Mycena haematopus]|nr:hypothetical protein B0H12DRAFT_1078829 [Mycena haematopus]
MDQGFQDLTFLVPKFHLPAHTQTCKLLPFSLTRYVGMTNGEAPERGWLPIFSRVMDPGFQDLVFSEILLTDHAAPRVPDNCESCETEDARFFCRSCFWPQFLCRVCILKAHARHPLHRVEMVMDKTLKGTTLQSLGLVIQLGHGVDGVCLNPEREGEFTVTASDGVHDVTMNFCGCPGARARGDQLEAVRLYGWRSQRSAVTFEVARYYEENLLIRGPSGKAKKKTKRAHTEG